MTLSGVFITELERSGDGPTLAIKDLFDTAGVRTTYGSAIYRDHVPAASAEAVVRLERAGYTSVGKANLHEFAWGITSENAHYGDVPNPLAPDRIPGGSSGGCAAALVAGLAEAALGTDSGGSIRIPAACCGVSGFKPTFGLVPLDGCFPLAPSFDTAGPMARDVIGCERMMAALAPGFRPSRSTRSATSRSASPGPTAPIHSFAGASRPPRRASRAAERSTCHCPSRSRRPSPARRRRCTASCLPRTASCTARTSR